MAQEALDRRHLMQLLGAASVSQEEIDAVLEKERNAALTASGGTNGRLPTTGRRTYGR